MFQKILAFFMAILSFFGIKIGGATVTPAIENITTFSVISECKYLQGACTDGRYIYQAFSHQVNSDKSGNYIFKIDTKNFEIVSKVQLTAGHMNDMTYNPRINKIISAQSGGTNSKAYIINVINPESLAVEDSINIGKNIYSIDYDAENDIYYAGRYDTSVIVLDSNFKLIDEFSVNFDDYTKQGMCCVNGNLNFILYGSKAGKPNVIRTFSNKGEFLGDYDISEISGEPEALFCLDGKIYVTYSDLEYKNGYIYRLNEFSF